MAGLKTVFGLIGELIRGLHIITGATALTIATLIYGVAWLWTQADKQPLEWPAPTRDCITPKAEKVSERELIAKAVAAWEADAAKYAPPYRQQYAGGPIVADKTKLSWIPTVPNDGRVRTAGEYDSDGGLRRDFFPGWERVETLFPSVADPIRRAHPGVPSGAIAYHKNL